MGFGAKAVRSMSLAALVLGLPTGVWPQAEEKAPAQVSPIQNQIKQHPNSSNLYVELGLAFWHENDYAHAFEAFQHAVKLGPSSAPAHNWLGAARSEEHTSELQSPCNLVCRLLLEKKKKNNIRLD